MQNISALLSYCYPKDFHALLQKICEVMTKDLEAEKCIFFLVDPKSIERNDKELLSYLYYSIYSASCSGKHGFRDFPKDQISRGVALDTIKNCSKELQENDIIWVKDITDSSYKGTRVEKEATKKYKKLSILCAPLIIQEADYYGSFYFDSTQKIFKAEDRQKLLATICLLLPLLKNCLSYIPFTDTPFSEMIGNSEGLRKARDMAMRFAPIDETILILGESGTGKELIARGLHRYSLRSKGPFISLNCAAIPESLIESELFGHEANAFTNAGKLHKGAFELADHGTLFLDEIGEMSMSCQQKILRALQEKEILRVGGNEVIKVDCRVVAATNKDLEKAVKEKTFREDLYYRIQGLDILLPPLRDRTEDIPDLATHFLNEYQDKYKKKRTFSPELLEYWKTLTWPGNVRELQSKVKKLFFTSDSQEITMRDFQNALNNQASSKKNIDPKEDMTVKEYQEYMIKKYASKVKIEQMTVEDVCKKIGIGRTKYFEKLKEYGI